MNHYYLERRAAITNHYYLELTPEQRMDPGWHPDYRPTWEAFFINRRERALAKYEGGRPAFFGLQQGRPSAVVGWPDSAGRYELHHGR